MRAQPTKSHFVNGQYRDGGGAPFTSIYPADESVIAQLQYAHSALVDEAIAGALEAQRAWAAKKPIERGRILMRAAQIIRERNQELSELESLDTGKAIQETIVADALSGADCLEFFGGIIAGITGDYIDLGGDYAYTRREPLGVCFGIGAWNYPIQIACWKSAPCLAAGNAMIFKPATPTPLSALKLAEIYIQAGLPAGLFQVIQGDRKIAEYITTHHDIAKVSLTGSVQTGIKVMENAARGLKKVTLELGGKSPLIVMPSANLDDAVGGAMLGNFYSTGQVCTNGTRVFVHDSVYDEFLKRAKKRTEAIIIGDSLNPETQMGPLVSKNQYDTVLEYIAIGKKEARLLTGGNRPNGFDKGYFIEPTIFYDCSDNNRIVREEIFGPVMSVLRFKTEEEVLARANDSEMGLAGAVFSQDITQAHRMCAQLQAGTIWINAYNLTPIEMPFGGYKTSGIGRENARVALDYYSQIKAIYVNMGPVQSPY